LEEGLGGFAGESLEIFDEVRLIGVAGGVCDFGEAGAGFAQLHDVSQTHDGREFFGCGADGVSEAALESALAETGVASETVDAQRSSCVVNVRDGCGDEGIGLAIALLPEQELFYERYALTVISGFRELLFDEVNHAVP
jgi:hypothetical protein